MTALIDTSLWIDFTRARSPRKLKAFIAPYILDPDAHLTEPIIFEMLRFATQTEAKVLTQRFQLLPMLATPTSLWTDVADLGQVCRQKNVPAKSLDLLIATVAIYHDADLVTFDDDFQRIASVSNLKVQLLKRPTP